MFVLEASLWLNSLPQKKKRKTNDEAEEDEGMADCALYLKIRQSCFVLWDERGLWSKPS